VSLASAPGRGERAWVALSGGVDSAVAAALALDAGCEVVGITMRLGVDVRHDDAVVAAARAVCDHLGIEHEVVDLSVRFRKAVVDPFVAAYLSGQTPNPCVGCNDVVKFGLLLDHALAHGASILVTGHYARTDVARGHVRLLRGRDTAKDQSYFLYRLIGARLEHVWFPLGDMTKDDVRMIARTRGLPSAGRTESQDVCFLAGTSLEALIAASGNTTRSGVIVDTSGEVIGEHQGIWRYTVGQRKGIGIGGGGPLYVVAIDADTDRVVVGTAAECGSTRVMARDVVWDDDRSRMSAMVQVRYRSQPVDALVEISGDELSARLTEPVTGVARGQSLVCYEGDTVLGGGYIEGVA